MIEQKIEKIKESVLKEKRLLKEMNSLLNYIKNADEQEKRMTDVQIGKLKIMLKKTNDELQKNLEEMNFIKPLEISVQKTEERLEEIPKKKVVNIPYKNGMSELDKSILKRLKKKREKIIQKKEKKPSKYVQIANKFFAEFVRTIIKDKKLATLEKDLIKSNLGYPSVTYISILILTTILSVVISIFLFIFFLFFNVSPVAPMISMIEESLGTRFLKVFWICFVIPLGTFLFMYFYPYLERKNIEGRINQELPFATIHMSAISGSMIEPVKVFSIISSTKEYPYLEKEFNKLLNQINIYGYDLVTALKDSAINSPSQKLSELFNGLATTITSGGKLYEFFDKRAQTMLFEYRLDKEKRTKTAETFMDIYISVVIAAPMILMLLLMMMKISGLGVALSTSTITFLVVGGVSVINIIFLIFLQIKQPEAM